MAAFFRKLLGIGKLPADLRAEAETENIIHLVDPSFTGRLSLTYKTAIPEAVLTTMPRRSLSFSVPPEWVLRTVGVPAARPV